jgi:hypothetical protein
MFFDKIIGSITQGKSVDRLINNSEVLTDIKDTFITGDPEDFEKQLQTLIGRFHLTSEDLKNLSIAGAINRMMKIADSNDKTMLSKLLDSVNKAGYSDLPASMIETSHK